MMDWMIPGKKWITSASHSRSLALGSRKLLVELTLKLTQSPQKVEYGSGHLRVLDFLRSGKITPVDNCKDDTAISGIPPTMACGKAVRHNTQKLTFSTITLSSLEGPEGRPGESMPFEQQLQLLPQTLSKLPANCYAICSSEAP